MTTKTVARDLLAAADYINTHGWCRGDFYNDKGQVCLAGAVGVATGAIRPLKANPGQWDWVNAKAPRARYSRAISALAAQLNAEQAQKSLAEYDQRTADHQTETWFKTYSPAQQQEYLTQRERGRPFIVQDIVTTFNDRETFVPAKKKGEKPTLKRTTKAQAVKLLQRTAAA